MATPTKPNSRLGTYVLKSFKDESFQAYVPPPLPPDPPLVLQPLLTLLEQANQALGRLDGLASILPDPSLFIYLYVRKEAVLSSQIEGTQSSFSDLMLFESAEAPGVPLEDVPICPTPRYSFTSTFGRKPCSLHRSRAPSRRFLI